MMDQITMVSLFGLDVTLYALLAISFYLLVVLFAILITEKHIPRTSAALNALLSGVLSLLLGRAIYSLVRMDSLFYSDMGEFLGFAPFFDFSIGNVSVAGVMLGVILSALICARLTQKKASLFLDHAVFPSLIYFTLMRWVEPLGGHGNGDLVLNPVFCFSPLARMNEWGDWFLAVNNIEAVLAMLVLLTLVLLKKPIRKPGTLSLYAATLLAATQIIPESLRYDDVLYIFIFARVTHIALAAMLFFALLIPLLQEQKSGLSKKTFLTELMLMLLGIILCIGSIFALDKTNLPKLLVYAVLFCTLSGLSCLCIRRIHHADMKQN